MNLAPGTFEWALTWMKEGKKLTRTGWNGANMWVVYQKGYPEGTAINENTAQATGWPEGTIRRFTPYLMMWTANETFTPWFPTSTDLFNNDWHFSE